MGQIKPKIVLVVDQPNWAFAISAEDMLLDNSKKIAEPMTGKDRETLVNTKAGLYQEWLDR